MVTSGLTLLLEMIKLGFTSEVEQDMEQGGVGESHKMQVLNMELQVVARRWKKLEAQTQKYNL